MSETFSTSIEIEIDVDFKYHAPIKGVKESETGLPLEPDDPEEIEVLAIRPKLNLAMVIGGRCVPIKVPVEIDLTFVKIRKLEQEILEHIKNR